MFDDKQRSILPLNPSKDMENRRNSSAHFKNRFIHRIYVRGSLPEVEFIDSSTIETNAVKYILEVIQNTLVKSNNIEGSEENIVMKKKYFILERAGRKYFYSIFV